MDTASLRSISPSEFTSPFSSAGKPGQAAGSAHRSSYEVAMRKNADTDSTKSRVLMGTPFQKIRFSQRSGDGLSCAPDGANISEELALDLAPIVAVVEDHRPAMVGESGEGGGRPVTPRKGLEDRIDRRVDAAVVDDAQELADIRQAPVPEAREVELLAEL